MPFLIRACARYGLFHPDTKARAPMDAWAANPQLMLDKSIGSAFALALFA